ncbi:MAG: lipase family protein [Flaviaesturariibacter sp.]|nr:lipase family protein [Flaviaesturariibacter sp.]
MKKTCFLLLAGVLDLTASAQSNCSDPNFAIPANEINAFAKFSAAQSPGVNKINAYFLSRLAQLVYPERLDFELRKLRNPSSFPPASFRSSQLTALNNSNFQCAYTQRFSHWFYDASKKPTRPATLNTGTLANVQANDLAALKDRTVGSDAKRPPTALERYLQDSAAFEKTKPQFKYLNKQQDFVNIGNALRIPGFDPELMVVSTEDYIILVWRGTDDIYKDDSWEWIGTDAYFVLTDGDGPLANTKLHSGFWNSFKLIRRALETTLDDFDAKAKNKKIFITGHSLGGAMAILSAPYLKGRGYNIGEVYTFAAPRVIGNQAFKNKCEDLLGDRRIQRYEYGVDFVTKLWSPALNFTEYKTVGKRHWLNANGADDDYNCAERRYPMTLNPIEYAGYSRMDIDKLNGDIGGADVMRPFEPVKLITYLVGSMANIAVNPPKDIRGFPLLDCGQHNPQFYVKKTLEQISAEDKRSLPAFIETFPFVYPSVAGNK